jgi:hypothetical protein
MFTRAIQADDVDGILASGEVVEDYPDDKPYPSRLLLGWTGKRPLHVVAAHNASENEEIVITVYEPDPSQWDSEFRRRRK